MDLKDKLSKTGDYIANNRKPLLYIGGALAIVIIGYAIVKKLKGTIGGDKIIGGKFNTQNIDKSKTTITETQAKNYAEELFTAFNYYTGTDKSAIEIIFAKLNPEDFKMVYNAFGKRSYSQLNGGTPSGKIYAPDYWLGFNDLDLIAWLNTELDPTDFLLKSKIRPTINDAGFAF